MNSDEKVAYWLDEKGPIKLADMSKKELMTVIERLQELLREQQCMWARRLSMCMEVNDE